MTVKMYSVFSVSVRIYWVGYLSCGHYIIAYLCLNTNKYIFKCKARCLPVVLCIHAFKHQHSY